MTLAPARVGLKLAAKPLVSREESVAQSPHVDLERQVAPRNKRSRALRGRLAADDRRGGARKSACEARVLTVPRAGD